MSAHGSLTALRQTRLGTFGDWTLRGIGQVFLQNNPLSGALFLVGIFLGSWFAGMDAVVGTVVATGTAMAFGVPRESLRQGLYGFNGALVAVALTFFLPDNWKLVVFVVIAAATSTVATAAVQNFLHTNHIPGLTAAFIATLWLFLAGLRQFTHLVGPETSLLDPHFPSTPTGSTAPIGVKDLLTGFFNGFSEVLLQSGVWTGVFILLGLLVNSRITATAAAIGSLAGFGAAWILGLPTELLSSGLAGYNSVLTMIALGGLYYVLSVRSAIFALGAGIVTVVLFGAMTTLLAPVGLPVSTAPFVLTTWTCLFAASSLKALRPVHPADATTPEGNLSRHVRSWSSENPSGFRRDEE